MCNTVYAIIFIEDHRDEDFTWKALINIVSTSRIELHDPKNAISVFDKV